VRRRFIRNCLRTPLSGLNQVDRESGKVHIQIDDVQLPVLLNA
jgi:hypothetical protein